MAIPAVAVSLKFMAVGSQVSHMVAINNIVMADGTGFQDFLQLSLGISHTCIKQAAKGQVYCFGSNSNGQLGLGHGNLVVGDAADEMGDNLPPVSLGTGRSARQIAAGE